MQENQRVFKSNVNTKAFIAILIVLSTVSLFFIILTSSLSLIATLISILITLNLLVQTKYTVKGNLLIVTTGFLTSKTIDIDSIREIKESGKLKIFYNKFDEIRISPKDKIEFIEYLKTLNTSIEVNAAA